MTCAATRHVLWEVKYTKNTFAAGTRAANAFLVYLAGSQKYNYPDWGA